MMWTESPLYNPVVIRELRTRVRGWRPAVLITAYMVFFSTLSAIYLVSEARLSIGQSSEMGIDLFLGLSSLQLLITLLITPSATATALSGERQRQTWELMLVTRLSTFRIAWGKLISGVAFNILLLFAAAPVLSFAFLFGGVGLGDVMKVYSVTVATSLFVGSMSIFISSLTRRVVASVIAANFTVLVPTVGLLILTGYLQATETAAAYYRPGCQFGRCGTVYTNPPLTPFAQLDPLIAMASALPKQGGGSYLGHLGTIHHAFGVLGTMPLWETYCLWTIVLSVGFTMLAARVARRWGRA